MFVVFMILPFLAIAYVAWHIWAILPFSAVWKSVIIVLGVACFLSLFLNFGRRFDTLPLPVATVCYEISTSSVFVLLYLVLLFLVLDLGRLVHLVPKSLLYNNWQAAAGIAVLFFGVFLYGNLHYKNKVRVPLELRASKPLPKQYKIVMASDLHIGYHNPRKELARWVDMINAEQPDFILIAGDIIDGSMRPLVEERMADEFRRLKAPVYACLGNHEYFAGEPLAQQFYKDAGIRLLIDEATVVDSSIVIIGRDDRTNQQRKSVADLTAPLKPQSFSQSSSINAKFKVQSSNLKVQSSNLKVQSSKYSILLDHQPYDLDRSEAAGIDFQLSGHTHRGQVWPISWITDAIYECSWGSHQRGNTQYYVSSGLGIWGGKFRIGTQSEYVVATLN